MNSINRADSNAGSNIGMFFPVLGEGTDMIYLNAASHGLPDVAVRSRMRSYLDREDEIGPAAAEVEAAEEMAAAYEKAARVIDAPVANVTLVNTTTIGWNAAVCSLPLAGRRVLVAPGEWSSGVAVLLRMGARVEAMPVDGQGCLDLRALQDLIDDDVAAISSPMVCSLTGEHYPLEKVAALERPDDTLLIVDAAQAVGQIPVSVLELGCDVLAATTRKWLRGPRDTALLYVSDKAFAQMRPNPAPRLFGITFEDGVFADHEGIRRFDPSSAFAPQRLGMGTALDRFLAGREAFMERPARLAQLVRELAAQAGLTAACPEAGTPTAITTLRLNESRFEAAMSGLKAANIAVATPAPSCEPLRPADTVAGRFLRISPHAYNTEDEITQVFEIIGSAA